MIIDLAGRRAVITGSSGGIGFEVARVLARAGADVVINGRSAETVDAALGRLRAEFPAREFLSAICDLSDPRGTDRIIAAAPTCDILVCNAAVNIIAGVLEQADQDYFDLFEINFLSPVRLARHYLPGMLQRGRGRVIFHNSEQALRPSDQMAAYGASKAALLAFARSAAEYTRGTEITVNTVIIGPTRSDVTTRLHRDIAQQLGKTVAEVEADFFSTYRQSSLLQRLVEGEEVGNMVAYLCCDHASATNGSVASVEGGTREALF